MEKLESLFTVPSNYKTGSYKAGGGPFGWSKRVLTIGFYDALLFKKLFFYMF